MTDAPTKERPAVRGKSRRREIDAKLRARIEATVQRMIDALDTFDALTADLEEDDPGGAGDGEDDEDNNDGEPSLGWSNTGHHGTNTDDREDDAGGEGGIGDDGGLAEQTTGEPSLGSFDRMVDQRKSWRQRDSAQWFFDDAEQDDADREDNGDLEATNEDGGDINDEPHDGENWEPSLGAPETGSGSQIDWAKGDTMGSNWEAGVGPSPATIAAARKRYRQNRSNVRLPDGRMFDASTGEPIQSVAPAQAGIAVEDRWGGSITLRGPDGKRYSIDGLRKR